MNYPPTELEETAIALHDFLWEVLDESGGLAEFSGGDNDCDRFVFLLNQLQAEIVARRLNTRSYADDSHLPW